VTRISLTGARAPGGAFGLPLVFEKSLARLELNGVDAALERLGGGCVLFEPRTRVGLFTEHEKHGARANYVNQSTDVEDTPHSHSGKSDECVDVRQTIPDVGMRWTRAPARNQQLTFTVRTCTCTGGR
jgi:hypothetical protein